MYNIQVDYESYIKLKYIKFDSQADEKFGLLWITILQH